MLKFVFTTALAVSAAVLIFLAVSQVGEGISAFLTLFFQLLVGGGIAVFAAHRSARWALENSKAAMLRQKKAEIYERLLMALHSEKKVHEHYAREYASLVSTGSEIEKSDPAWEDVKNEWARAMSVAGLYLDKNLVDELDGFRKTLDKNVKGTAPSDYFNHDLCIKYVCECIGMVEEQARKELGKGK